MKIIDHINSKTWPPASPKPLLINTQKQQETRSRSIIRWILKQTPNLIDSSILQYSNDKYLNEAIDELGINHTPPYDHILIYDHLEHIHDPINILKSASQQLSYNGIIHLWCHPYTSKHGGHLFELNKAYSHILLNKCGIFTHKILDNPINYYDKLISKTDLCIIKREVFESAFYQQLRRKSIMTEFEKIWNYNESPEQIESILKIDNIYYQLSHSKTDVPLF